MSTALHKTKGIVLRAVKYGETSLIVTIFTELFGVQSYIVNGVRTSSKKGQGKANLFQPSANLDLVVYHQEIKNLQRLRDFRWGMLYQHIFSDIPKNAVAMFMVELLTKCLKQPEGIRRWGFHHSIALGETRNECNLEAMTPPIGFTGFQNLHFFYACTIQEG